MKNYMYEHETKDRGYADAKTLSHNELQKYVFVVDHLNKTLREANCGWENLEYKVMETPSGHRTEFLVLWAEEVGNSGSRWINVTGNSLGAVMCAMCDNLW
jgi:hypothetical protein